MLVKGSPVNFTLSISLLISFSKLKLENIYFRKEWNLQYSWTINTTCISVAVYIDDLVQKRHNSFGNAMELRLSCTKPPISEHYQRPLSIVTNLEGLPLLRVHQLQWLTSLVVKYMWQKLGSICSCLMVTVWSFVISITYYRFWSHSINYRFLWWL